MDTQRIRVADGVELTADVWLPSADIQQAEPAFLLVHGLASNARLWDGVAGRLTARGHRAVTVDLRGHGRSSKPDGPYDVPTVADDLAALVRALDLGRPIVAGQSWGGNVVLELAVRHPGVAGAVASVDGGWIDLASSFGTWEACAAALAPPRLVGLHRDEIKRHIRRVHPDWPETGIEGTLANFEIRPDGTVAPWLTFDRHMTVLRGLWDHHPSERYAAVSVPVLLIPAAGGEGTGDADKRRAIEVALAALPDARAYWLTGDHDLHAQHPDELADVMLTLVTRGGVA